jgi:hypothetical protein
VTSVLDIMSRAAYADGITWGGYKLLRYEFRVQAGLRKGGLPATARIWLDDITRMLACGSTGNVVIRDLYENGDILEEDIRVLGEVLSRYVKLREMA